MRRIILSLLIFMAFNVKAQTSLTWKGFIVKPDIYISLPGKPRLKRDSTILTYEVKIDNVILRVTSEKSPLNYYGRTVKEVNDEYYGNLTASIITSKRKLLHEENFDFESHNVRKLVYMDSIDKKPCIVTLEILNVTGFQEAMYKFYLIDFQNRTTFPDEYRPFFSDWDLYYNLENNLNKYKESQDKILKKQGFKIEK